MTVQTTTTNVAVSRPGVRPRRRITAERWVSILSPIVLLVLWEFLARTDIIDSRIFPPPTKVLATVVELTVDGRLLQESGATIARFLTGLALGAIPGTILGLAMGLNRWVRAAMDPLVRVFYPIPHIALFPLILIAVGLNESSNLIMVALGPFFTMVITAANAVRNLSPIHLEVARSFGEKLPGLCRRVVIPGVLPPLLSGLQISLGLALVGAVAVEFLTGVEGLGGLIWRSWQVLSLANSMAGLISVAVIGFLSLYLLALAEKYLTPWQVENKRRR